MLKRKFKGASTKAAWFSYEGLAAVILFWGNEITRRRVSRLEIFGKDYFNRYQLSRKNGKGKWKKKETAGEVENSMIYMIWHERPGFF
jgi:hypothetical protein